jgi:ankyrin repeat protein
MTRIEPFKFCTWFLLCATANSPQPAEAAGLEVEVNRAVLAAVRDGDEAALEQLLVQGADVNAKDDSGATPLLHASVNSDVRMMELLIKHGANVSAATKTGGNALSSSLHDPEKVKLLLKHGANISGEAIFAAAAIPRGASVMRLFADAGAELNLNKNGFTTLMAASRSASPDMFQILIAKGADARARSRIGFTALYGAASWRGAEPIIRFLLQEGASPNVRVDLSGPANDVITPLMGAAMHGDAPTVQALLDNGADPNAQGGDFGRTALLLAATTGSEATVKLLVERGARVSASDWLGNSPLHWAARRGDATVVNVLKKAGAKEFASSAESRARPRLQTASSAGAVERALASSLPLLQRSGLAFSKQRGCVSCHHQSLVAIVVGKARQNGIEVDEATAAHEHSRVLSILEKNQAKMLMGSGVTDELAPAYILAGLDAGGQTPNRITDALVQFLVLRQQPDGSWKTPVNRPPQDASDITFTALAVRGLNRFAPKGRAKELEGRTEQARTWLRHARTRETEDMAFRLLGLHWASAAQPRIAEARDALLAQQRADGGWGQLPTLESDAYASGLALFALHEGSGIAAGESSFRRGVEYLLKTQLADGSWFVQTRSFPLQPFVETHFPHERSQFISLAATCWASISLNLAVDKRDRR